MRNDPHMVRVDDALWLQAKAKAASQRSNISVVVRQALIAYVNSPDPGRTPQQQRQQQQRQQRGRV